MKVKTGPIQSFQIGRFIIANMKPIPSINHLRCYSQTGKMIGSACGFIWAWPQLGFRLVFYALVSASAHALALSPTIQTNAKLQIKSQSQNININKKLTGEESTRNLFWLRLSTCVPNKTKTNFESNFAVHMGDSFDHH